MENIPRQTQAIAAIHLSNETFEALPSKTLGTPEDEAGVEEP